MPNQTTHLSCSSGPNECNRRQIRNPRLCINPSSIYQSIEIDNDAVQAPYDDGKWENEIGTFLERWLELQKTPTRATLWITFIPSVNFHHPGHSAFIVVAGARRMSIISALSQYLVSLIGNRHVRLSDSLHGREVMQWRSAFHVQNHIAWKRLDTSWVRCVPESTTSRIPTYREERGDDSPRENERAPLIGDSDKTQLKQVLDQACDLASQDWLDPNERCAAVTIALALIVSPDEVTISEMIKYLGGGWSTQYRNVQLHVPADVSRASVVFSRLSPSPPLINLAEKYEDHHNNLHARDLLKRYRLCSTPDQLAALLALAWVCLVRGYRALDNVFVVRPSAAAGYIIRNSEVGASVRFNFAQTQVRGGGLDERAMLRGYAISSSVEHP